MLLFVVVNVLIYLSLSSPISQKLSFPGLTLEVYQTELNGTVQWPWFQRNSDQIANIGTCPDTDFLNCVYYYSADSGATFNQISFPNSTFVDTSYPLFYGPGIFSWEWSPANPLVGYFQSSGGYLYVTTNGGQSFTTSFPTVSYANYTASNLILFYILPHPYKDSWALGVHLTPVCSKQSSAYNQTQCDKTFPDTGRCPCPLTWGLSYTKDFGTTWTNVWADSIPYTNAITWGDAGFNGVSNETAYVCSFQNGDSIDGSVFYKTTDLFKTIQPLTNSTFPLDNVQYYPITNQITAWHNAPVNPTQYQYIPSTSSFRLSQFPVNNNTASGSVLTYNYYNLEIVDGTHFTVVLRTGHITGNSVPRGDLYVSDTIGSAFTVSLSNISFVRGGPVFNTLLSVGGVFQANVWESASVQKSVITYNNGLQWGPIPAPLGEECTGCSLHLWGSESPVNRRFGVKSAKYGFIIANGNVGPAINPDPSIGNLYASRDAGLSWSRISDGTWVFAVSRYAGLIVKGDWQNPSSSVDYSHDQGLTWTSVLFTDPQDNETHTIRNIFFSDSGTEQAPVPISRWQIDYEFPGIFWVETTGTNSAGASINSLFWVNFANLLLPNCTQVDYETYSPTNQSCIQGRKYSFIRRKSTSLCQPDHSVLAQYTYTQCPCTRDDYYCVYCYVPDKNQTCVLDTTNPDCAVDPTLPSSCSPGSQLSIPSVYRKSLGSYCVGDVAAYTSNRTYTCPSSPNPNPSPIPSPAPPPSESQILSVGYVIFLSGIILFLLFN